MQAPARSSFVATTPADAADGARSCADPHHALIAQAARELEETLATLDRNAVVTWAGCHISYALDILRADLAACPLCSVGDQPAR